MNFHKILKWLQAKLGGQSMPNLKKLEIADIEVIVTPAPGNPADMSFAFPTKNNGKVKHWKSNADGMYHVSFENQGGGGFIVVFNIEDDNGTGCRFHNDSAEAMYCHGQPSCPPGKSSWEHFTPIGVINEGRTLVVFNLNDKKRDFGFTLRFTTNYGDREFDPIGDDMNG